MTSGNVYLVLDVQTTPIHSLIQQTLETQQFTAPSNWRDPVKIENHIQEKRDNFSSEVAATSYFAEVKDAYVQIVSYEGEETRVLWEQGLTGSEPSSHGMFYSELQRTFEIFAPERLILIGRDVRNATKILAAEAARQGYPLPYEFWYGARQRFDLDQLLPVCNSYAQQLALESLQITDDDLEQAAQTCQGAVEFAIRLATRTGVIH